MTQNSNTSDIYNILVIGASFGLLPAAKIAVAGHSVTVVGRHDEVQKLQRSGVEIYFDENRILRPPIGLMGLTFASPIEVDVNNFDLVFLAFQEPQIQDADLYSLITRIADNLPVASIMNMPIPPFLKRLQDFPEKMIGRGAYQHPELWNVLPSERITMASPDPQVMRPNQDRPGYLQVTLQSNFKFAPFLYDKDQAILSRVARDASRIQQEWGRPPVHLLARGSIFTPLVKWPMLVTGNCRCWNEHDEVMPIYEAINRDIGESRHLYEAVNRCLKLMGVPPNLLVPFEKYVLAAESLTRPSSLASGLQAGALDVERVDILILNLIKYLSDDLKSLEIMMGVSVRIDQLLQRNKINSLHGNSKKNFIESKSDAIL